jgi:hypothetical protein
MFYEVSPYYVLLEERHGSCPGMSRRVHAGFDVEIYGANVRNELAVRGPDPVYGLGCAELQKVSDKVSSHTSGSCLLESSKPMTAGSIPRYIPKIDRNAAWAIK